MGLTLFLLKKYSFVETGVLAVPFAGEVMGVGEHLAGSSAGVGENMGDGGYEVGRRPWTPRRTQFIQ